MELHPSRWIFDHWQRKVVALLTALIAWFFVNHSIIDTKVIPNIAVKVINLPADKAIVGLQPNGLLSRRITLTLSGTKDVIMELEAGDIEVVVDASAVDDQKEWVVDVTKKNLVSLNPAINLAQHITQVEHGDFIIKLSPLITVQVPVTVVPIVGDLPVGYSFVDMWPQQLKQTITGPEEEVLNIKAKGLRYEFDLSRITKADLEHAKSLNSNIGEGGVVGNEVLFYLPNKWKKIALSVQEGGEEEINDPEAKYLHVTFLQQQWLPVDTSIPAHVYYPFSTLAALNPQTHPLVDSSKVAAEHAVHLLKTPLYVYDVGDVFLNHIRQNLEIVVIATQPTNEHAKLQWSLEVVNTTDLEDSYVEEFMNKEQFIYASRASRQRREQMLRQRFRTYLQRLTPYSHPKQPLHLECVLSPDNIHIN
jgi:hypothetical protein